MNFLQTFFKAVAAGLSISVGAASYLMCDNKIVGALLFTVGLFTICFFGLNLYTGKIGYLLDMEHPVDCLTIWFGNAVGCVLGGLLLRLALPRLAQTARALTEAKLSVPIYRAAILGLFCGMLMYIAVHNYRENPHMFGKCVGIFVCIPAFILCGFEHCIANVVYFTLGITSVSQLLPMLLMTVVVTAANAVGAVAFRKLSLAFSKKGK
ncbi:MAG: formate/nitrite transporter family protein [Clostridia bacterium]|nr:formate/nitrite transporter family protein [Clostridia bacterium]